MVELKKGVEGLFVERERIVEKRLKRMEQGLPGRDILAVMF
jgi:hypothetical protein